MPHHSDPGIPTLTQRAEPALSPLSPAPAPARQGDEPELPVLTQVADAPPSGQAPNAAGGAGRPQAAWSATAAGDAVLRSALQAELEQALQHAVDDAAAGLQARLEAELPALIERAMRSVRPG